MLQCLKYFVALHASAPLSVVIKFSIIVLFFNMYSYYAIIYLLVTEDDGWLPPASIIIIIFSMFMCMYYVCSHFTVCKTVFFFY